MTQSDTEDRYRDLVEASPDSIFSFTAAGEYSYANPAFAAGVGKPLQDIIGKKLWDVFPKDEADKRFEALTEVFRTGNPKVIESRVPRAEGDAWYVTTITPLLDSEGLVSSAMCSSKNITLRKRAEEALRLSERHLRSVITQTPLIIWELDRAGNILLSEGRALAELGLKPGQLVGKSVTEVYKDHPGVLSYILRGLAGEDLVSEVELGGRVWSNRYSPLRDAQGNVTGLVGVTMDISERKRAEDDRSRLEGQLQQAQKMESVGRLAGGVAHDFNNMLGVILGHAELAMEQLDPSHPLHLDLEQIHKAAVRSADVTRQLLAFARKQTVAPRLLDLNETVTSMLKMLQRLIGENIRLVWEPAEGLWPVEMDPSQLDQILANLCVNARDAIADVGRIRIETANQTFVEADCAAHPGRTPGDHVRLTVSDDGCGMDERTRAHLFEPFFTTKEVGKGTGLGLATIYGIVKQNGGSIDVASTQGAGTAFTIWLPRSAGDARRAGRQSAGPTLRGRETILLVEDEPAILDMTRRMLERLGYTVLPASTPIEALRVAREHRGEIHLLMTDVVMPEMNGRDLAKNVLALHPQLARLFMSGYTASVIAHHGVLEPGVNFIQKPFSRHDLATKVRAALDGATGVDPGPPDDAR